MASVDNRRRTLSDFEQARQAAILTLGTTNLATVCETDRFDTGWSPVVSGGSPTTSLAVSGGGTTARASTGTTMNSIAALQSGGGHIINGIGQKWFIRCRAKFEAVAGAGIQGFIGIMDLAASSNHVNVWMGLRTVTSATNFAIGRGAGGTIIPGATLDTSWHTFTLYTLGDSVLRGYMDGTAEASLSLSGWAPGNCLLAWSCWNPNDTTDVAIRMDTMAAYTDRSWY